MPNSWTVIFIALGYVGLLFAIASYGDRQAKRRVGGTPRPLIYALSLGVYCTSWTFFGSVGLSALTGYEFLAIYLGPILVWVAGWPLLQWVVTFPSARTSPRSPIFSPPATARTRRWALSSRSSPSSGSFPISRCN